MYHGGCEGDDRAEQIQENLLENMEVTECPSFETRQTECLYLQRLSMDTNSEGSSVCQKIRERWHHMWPLLCRRRSLAIIISGQFLSLLLCAAGVGSQKLVTDCGVKIPALQAFLLYLLLALVFTSQIAYNNRKTIKMVKERWWKYIILAAIDVEANFAVYTAYEYTSLTSVQLLDCLSIPVVVILSILILKAKYGPVHFFGVSVCLAGIGFLVWADINGSRSHSPGNVHRELLGDVLVIVGAAGYGASNVAAEVIVKTSTVTEFLGMMSFFACFLSGANVIMFEKEMIENIVWDYKLILFLCLSVLAMFSFYILMPLLFRYSSATLVNLMLLTADFYSLLAGLYLFNYVFSGLYIVSFVIIIVGVVIFKVFPTPSRLDECEHVENPRVVNDRTNSEEECLVESGSLD